MPELPDLTVYAEALQHRTVGEHLERVRLVSPFLLRSADPPISTVEGRRVEAVRRLGKRLVLSLVGDLHLVLHLMIAGRLRWDPAPGARIPGKVGLAAFDFGGGTLILTEAASRKRAALRLVRGARAVAALHPGGLEPLEATVTELGDCLRQESRTLKRALTDQRLIAGIGNAYSDEVLHRARLSPAKLTRSLSDEQIGVLYAAMRAVLLEWTERIRAEAARTGGFPEKVTAFRAGLAVHGRYGQPCPSCGTPVQRIVYASNEANYCPTCQTEGRLLADRALSRLLRSDWPRTLEELETRKAASRRATPHAANSADPGRNTTAAPRRAGTAAAGSAPAAGGRPLEGRATRDERDPPRWEAGSRHPEG